MVLRELVWHSQERVVNKRQIREMRHQAGIKPLDFTLVMIVGGAFIIGSRYLAIGLGDTALYHSGDGGGGVSKSAVLSVSGRGEGELISSLIRRELISTRD